MTTEPNANKARNTNLRIRSLVKVIFERALKMKTTIIYGIIGVTAVVVDMSVFFALYNFLFIDPVMATIISVATATLYSFFTNVHLNFKTKDFIKTRLASFITVSLIGMGLSALAIAVFTSDSLSANLVKVFSLPPIVLLQYVLNANLTFRSSQKQDKTDGHPSEFSEQVDRRWRRHKKIAVIGGGFTGLTAAYELSKVGYQVTVFEAGSELGGLVAGFDLDGVPLEKAYHFLYKTDSDIISLANEIGVGDKLHFHPSSLSLYYDGKLYPFMTPKDLLSFTPLKLTDRIRAGVIALYLSWQTRWRPFAQVTAMNWMNRFGGREVTRVIWEPILRGKFFNYSDQIAMSYVWSRVYVRANSKDRGDVTEKLGYFDGGFQSFIKALVGKCRDQGVTFVCNAKIQALTSDNDGNSATVTYNDQTHRFDSVLSTTPSHIFSKLIEHNPQVDQDYISKLNSIDYLGAVLMVFATDKKFTDYYWHNINDASHPFLVLLSLSALVGPERLNGKHIYYIGAYLPHDHHYFQTADQDIAKEWINGVKEIFPDFDPATITDSKIFRFKNAQHIVDVGYEQKIPDYQSPVPGVFLANFSQIFPDDRGTNYAVQEGQKTARLIDHELVSRKYKPFDPDNEDIDRLKNPDVSLILPTFNEAGNITPLVKRIRTAMRSSQLQYECIFVDDSRDQTANIIAREAKRRPQTYLIKRQGAEARTGLTKAFYRGFQSARGRYIVCMDTDLQHPPEKIPELIRSLDQTGSDLVVASRYISGGRSDGLAGRYRRWVSKLSSVFVWTFLTPTRKTSDPMTGFFAFKRDLLDRVSFSSFGFKILVEILASIKDLKVVDIPFTFGQRVHENSKASLSQGWAFLKDVGQLFITPAGSPIIKHLILAVFIFFFFNTTQLLSWPWQPLSVAGLTNYSLTLVGLFVLNIILTPIVFSWLFSEYNFRQISWQNVSLIVLWITLNSWIFIVVNRFDNFTGLTQTLVESSLFVFSSLLTLIIFRPLWTKNKAQTFNMERWFLIGLIGGISIIVIDFLTLSSLWNITVLMIYIAIVIQGLFALYLIIYAWESKDNQNQNSLPEEMADPHFSFTAIVPCKHEKSVINDTLKSLSQMNYPSELIQILVVIHRDSDDGTIEVAEKAIGEIGRSNIEVVTYNQAPVNKPHGLNVALKKAVGDYVVIFDAEDETQPDLLKAINTVLLDKKFDVLQSGVQLMNYNSSWYSLFNVLEYYFWFKSTLHFFARHGVVPLGGVTVFFRRSWLEKIGGWNQDCLTEDAEIGIRLSTAGAKIGIVYDARYATQEETPHSLWSFIKQRTRWAQGFLQILSYGQWLKLPTFRAKLLSLYILAWPLILLPLALVFPVGIILAFVYQLPPILALLANIPLLLFLIFIAVQILGLHEFCRDYQKPFPWRKIPLMVVSFYIFTLVLAFAGVRAIYRQSRQITTWEKTEHLNTYRSKMTSQSLELNPSASSK